MKAGVVRSRLPLYEADGRLKRMPNDVERLELRVRPALAPSLDSTSRGSLRFPPSLCMPNPPARCGSRPALSTNGVLSKSCRHDFHPRLNTARGPITCEPSLISQAHFERVFPRILSVACRSESGLRIATCVR